MKPAKNCNELAKLICEAEGGKVNLSIAQVKEVIRIIGDRMLADYFKITTETNRLYACENLTLDARNRPSTFNIIRAAAARRYLRRGKK